MAAVRRRSLSMTPTPFPQIFWRIYFCKILGFRSDRVGGGSLVVQFITRETFNHGQEICRSRYKIMS